jgi:alpha-D-ribose 1-methylphosphonate 5-triphosphate synthase subunit PhnL
MSAFAIEIRDLEKTFTLHIQGGVRLPVLRRVRLAVKPGECVVLADASGSGKSTLLRAVYGNYVPQAGHIFLRHRGEIVDMVGAEPRLVLDVRRRSVGHVSQFLRVVPRVSALEVVAEPLRSLDVPRPEALDRARRMLERLRIPERLWTLSPVTFSGGEQQRVNIARVFVAEYPILLLDEPTAALDAASRLAVIELIREATARGAAVLGSVHDVDVREAVATSIRMLADAEVAA